MTRRIPVGVLGAPHGVRGEVRFKPLTEHPLAIRDYGPLETEDGSRRFTVHGARLQGDMVVLKLDGVADRAAAAALTNMRLFVPRERLPPAGEGEYYTADLIGLRVEDEAGVLIGEVAAIRNYGAGDLIEVRRAGKDTALVPFVEGFVPTIDLAGGRIVIAPPAGLLDDAGAAEDPGEESRR